ncbi:kinase-like protein [Lindgomyces ingoldianus]|uniref:Kinase-like protein n=1 Tax=Lindgomyces ingoldianus TaxID=673940 RepID=A0ACB6R6H7_9PLEO|nr:kinase-like protein [Lindgomyces ingoldianus]KAF2474443.1 kinase-like protein [Lindgomyces ingoldianus]
MASLPACTIARNNIIDRRYEEYRKDVLCKSFFPLDKLRSYLKADKVRDILRCNCDQCKAHRKFFNDTDPLNYLYRITGVEDGTKETKDRTKTAYSLFSLLIYVQHPLLIVGFMEKERSDFLLEFSASSFTKESLKDYTGRYHANDSGGFARFASEFIKAMPEFCVPHMESGEFTHYEANVILPFIEEKEIGKKIDASGQWTSEGANGKVFKFKIYTEYQNFPHAAKVEWFARKKIETPEFKAYLEKANLRFAHDFKNKHIVKLIKAYWHGDSLNLIMPLAVTNLDHLLRDSVLDYGKKRGGPLESCNAWEQLLGVSMALRQISGLDNEKAAAAPDSIPERLCIHFDLKPDNILIDCEKTWVITDFGQAAIAYSNGRTPRVANHFGTDAYAPPEIENVNMAYGRKYDIWSLGCIILEVTAFVVLGYAGLKGSRDPETRFEGLDEVRGAKPAWQKRKDERFFYRETPLGDYVVKKEVRAFMENLENTVATRDHSGEKSKAFIRRILHLIERMLKPKVEERIDIAEVVRMLSDAIKQASPGTAVQNEAQMVPAAGESILGGPQLSSLSLWHKIEGTKEWEKACLEAFENEAGFMRLQCWANGRLPNDINFRRADVKILPLYAFWPQDHLDTSGTWIKFFMLSHGPTSELANAKFSFSENSPLEAARIVQSKLTSQSIEASFALSSVRLKQFVPVAGKVLNETLRYFKSAKAEQKAEDYIETKDLGSATIQLWIEQVDEAAANRRRKQSSSSEGTYSNRAVRVEHHYQSGYRELPPRRAVIYFHDCRFICTIKMDVNWILEENEDDPFVLYFQPNKPRRDPHFVASWIRPTPEEQADHHPAGLPLSPLVLQYFEDLDRFEADRFELRFATWEARDEFRIKYLAIKREWDLERKELEKTQGYTPVNRRPDRNPHPDLVSSGTIPKPKQKARFSFGQTALKAIMEPPPVAEPKRASLPKVDKGKGRAIDNPEDPEIYEPALQRQEYLTVPNSPASPTRTQPHLQVTRHRPGEHPREGQHITRSGRGPKKMP